VLAVNRAHPILTTTDVRKHLERCRGLRSSAEARGEDVAALDRDIAVLERVLKGVTPRRPGASR
jgi:hypothetical protein